MCVCVCVYIYIERERKSQFLVNVFNSISLITEVRN